MPISIIKVRAGDSLLRSSRKGLMWCYFMKLREYCANKWKRVAERAFLNSLQSFRRNNARKTLQSYWTKLSFFRYFSPKAASKGRMVVGVASPSQRRRHFKVRVACDLYGMKKNVRLSFSRRPPLGDLVNAVEGQFDPLARSCRPAGFPDVPFQVEMLQVFNHDEGKWVDLEDEQQLAQDSQIFCFPPASSWHSDSQGIIPDAREVYTWLTAEGSPHRKRQGSQDRGLSPAQNDKARFVFYDMCRLGRETLQISDLRTGFAKCDMIFDVDAENALFSQADSNKDGVVTITEWLRFAADQPNVVDALYFRTKDLYTTPNTRARAGHSHLTTVSSYNDPHGNGHLQSSEKLRLAQEYQVACRDAEQARERSRQAELKEAQARERLRSVQ